jgi:HPt (histidine-containing phosphotransfer) domain-containing protein
MSIAFVNASSTLDLAAIERLVKLGGNQFVRQMIELFLDFVGKKVTEIRLAQQAGNLVGVAAAAHPIKSSAGNVGALRLQELAARIEQLAKAAQSDELASLLNELEIAFAEVATLLETEKSKLPPRPV